MLADVLAGLEEKGVQNVLVTTAPPVPGKGYALPPVEQLQEAAKAIRTYRGCGAGRTRIALNASGQLQPCRFMPFPEDCTSVSEYWENSALLQKLRRTEEERSAPCSTCLLRMNCLPCAAACIQADELTEAPQGCTISG